jgi:hypothetical protein
VLLFGSADLLPGTSRDLDGLGYRVFMPPAPSSWSTYLNEPRLGDEALASFLDELLGGEVRRAGARLAPFGIGWVAFAEPSPLESLFETQLDLLPLRSFDFAVFRNEVATGVAVGADGSIWSPDGAGFVRAPGSFSASVVVATNADERWGPGSWSQQNWANGIITDDDSVRFGGYRPRLLMAIGSLGWLVLLLVVSAAGWWRGRS